MPLAGSKVVHDRRSAAAQKVHESAMPSRATLKFPTSSSDGRGGQKTTTISVPNVPCRYHAIGTQPKERELAARLASIAEWVVAFAVGTSLDNTVEMDLDNHTFRVVEVLSEQSYEVEMRVACTEVK